MKFGGDWWRDSRGGTRIYIGTLPVCNAFLMGNPYRAFYREGSTILNYNFANPILGKPVVFGLYTIIWEGIKISYIALYINNIFLSKRNIPVLFNKLIMLTLATVHYMLKLNYLVIVNINYNENWGKVFPLWIVVLLGIAVKVDF